MKKLYALILVSLLSFHFTHAQVGQLWGITSSGGGPDSAGTIFRINVDGSGFTTVHSFDTLTGSTSYGSLVPALNGLLYGLGNKGGLNSSGVIFSYDPVNNIYQDVYNFNYFNGDGYPENSLVAGGDGNLYGMTLNGGPLNISDGSIFSFDPIGGIFSTLYTFVDSAGRFPYGNLVLNSHDGKFYGLTSQGGHDSVGVLFSFDPNGMVYTKLHDFTHNTGDSPQGTLLLAGNGLFYGMTASGGIDSDGVIFSFDPSGNTYKVVHQFNDTTGASPYGGLIQFADGLLYGMASGGGAQGDGVIFNFDPTDSSYGDLFDFSGPDGSTPAGELFAATNNKLYGMTEFGGPPEFNSGVLFSFDPVTSIEDTLLSFNIANGQYPSGDLIEIFSTGVAENSRAEDIKIYPNPVHDELRITDEKLSMQNATLRIENILGQTVLQSSIFNYQSSIDVKGLSSGLYFVRIIGEQENWTGKFVKQ